MQVTDKLQHSPSATHQVVGEAAIIVDINTGSTYSLNDTGTMFWQLINGQRTIAECAQLIAQEYDVEASLVEADLLELALEFQKEGLVIV